MNDPSSRACRGTLCVVSNDSGFGRAFQQARQEGWRTALVCDSGAGLLLREANCKTFAWKNCCKARRSEGLEVFCATRRERQG